MGPICRIWHGGGGHHREWIYQKSANFIGPFLRKRVFCAKSCKWVFPESVFSFKRGVLTSAICLQCLTGQNFLHHDGRFGIPLTTHKGKIKRLARLTQSNWYKKSLAWILAKIKFYDIDLPISTRTTSTTCTGCIWPWVAGKLLGRLQILARPVVPPCGVAPGSRQLFKLGDGFA